VGAYLVFIDESGFFLIPTVRKTWAPVGRTPVIRHRFRNHRISAISALSVSPKRLRMGLYWMLSLQTIRREQVCRFLEQLLRHLRGPVVAFLDNSNTHRGKPIGELLTRNRRLRIEYLPPYAPELNPDEGVWSSVKGKLANGSPDQLRELRLTLRRELTKLARSQDRLRGCIWQSDLPPFLP
jgi:transposase